MTTNEDPNYKRPRPSLCDCEEDYHDPNCLFYDPIIDDAALREEVAHYQAMIDTEDETDDGDGLVYDPYYGCYVPIELVAENAASGPIVTGSGLPSLAVPMAAWKSCRHYMDAFTLPSGITVYLSGWSHTPVRRPAEMYPDVGVYLDRQWCPPDNFAYVVGWEDYGLPTVPDWHVTRTARAAIAHAEQGDVVEVGCLGAHGRTGSFLAIMVMLDDPSYSGKRAIKYVRENHCKHAVETKEQERYVSLMAGMLKRGEA